MLELEVRLRDQFEEMVRDLEPSDRLDELVHERRQQRIRRRRWGTGGLAAAGIVATLLVAEAVLPSGDGGSSVVAVSPSDAGDPLFLVPGEPLPDGFELLEASGGDQPGVDTDTVVSQDWDATQRWVRFDGTGEHPVDVIDIEWREGPVSVEDVRSSEAEGWVEGPVDDGQGVRSLVRVHGYVAPEDPAGPVTPLTLDVLNQVLDEVVARSDGGVLLAAGPEGFELVGEWPGVASEGTNPRVLAYGEPDVRGFQLQIVDDSELPPSTSLFAAAARRVTVRGNEGVATPHLFSRPSLFDPDSVFLANADRYVQWVEPDGERVTLSALGMTDAEVLALADSLEVVDAEAWSALQDDLAPEPDVAGPSASAPPTSGAPGTATTAGAPAGQVQIAGSYEGTELYTLTTGRCDLDHVLDTTWSASDGTTWTFHQEYCGLLDGDFWTYGGGSFTLTAPDGATLTGDARTHSALAPTYTNRDGPGITLAIGDGTGRFDGATGQCALTNRVTQVTFGEQRQDGTFTCEFTP
jgi:hypothetical protein